MYIHVGLITSHLILQTIFLRSLIPWKSEHSPYPQFICGAFHHTSSSYPFLLLSTSLESQMVPSTGFDRPTDHTSSSAQTSDHINLKKCNTAWNDDLTCMRASLLLISHFIFHIITSMSCLYIVYRCGKAWNSTSINFCHTIHLPYQHFTRPEWVNLYL